MSRIFTLGQQIVSGFCITVLSVLVLGYLSYSRLQEVRTSNTWLMHSHEVLTELSVLMSSMDEAEYQQRDFVLSGQSESLQGYQRAVAAIEPSMEKLTQLTKDNPQQQRALASLHPLLQERVSQLELALEKRRPEDMELAVKLITANVSRKLKADIYRQGSEIANTERSLFNKRALRHDLAVRRATMTLLLGCAATLFAMVCIAYGLRIQIRKQIGSAAASLDESAARLRKEARQQAHAARNLSGITAHIRELLGDLVASSRHIRESARDASDTASQATTLAREGEQATLALRQLLIDQKDLHALAKKDSAPDAPQPLPAVMSILDRITKNIMKMAATTLSIELASQQQNQFLEEVSEVSEATAKYAVESESTARRTVEALDELAALSQRMSRFIEWAPRPSGTPKEVKVIFRAP